MKRQKAWQRERIVRINVARRKRVFHGKIKYRKRLRAHPAKRGSSVSLTTPECFSLANPDTRKPLFQLIDDLHLALNQGRSVIINFSRTKHLLPDGTLYFVANLDRAINEHPDKITCNYPADNTVEQLFQHINLLPRMGRSPRLKITADNVRYWHFVSGTSARDVSEFTQLIDECKINFDSEASMSIYASLSEAVTNTIHHAYPILNVHKDVPRPWWMFAQRIDDVLTIAICDLGIGIAESLKRKPEWKDYLLRWHNKTRDKKLIEAATGRRSSTKLPHRGRGLPDMLNFVRTSQIGGMIIHSNRGAYSYDVLTHTDRAIDVTPTLPGTLIQWTLSIAGHARTT